MHPGLVHPGHNYPGMPLQLGHPYASQHPPPPPWYPPPAGGYALGPPVFGHPSTAAMSIARSGSPAPSLSPALSYASASPRGIGLGPGGGALPMIPSSSAPAGGILHLRRGDKRAERERQSYMRHAHTHSAPGIGSFTPYERIPHRRQEPKGSYEPIDVPGAGVANSSGYAAGHSRSRSYTAGYTMSGVRGSVVDEEVSGEDGEGEDVDGMEVEDARGYSYARRYSHSSDVPPPASPQSTTQQSHAKLWHRDMERERVQEYDYRRRYDVEEAAMESEAAEREGLEAQGHRRKRREVRRSMGMDSDLEFDFESPGPDERRQVHAVNEYGSRHARTDSADSAVSDRSTYLSNTSPSSSVRMANGHAQHHNDHHRHHHHHHQSALRHGERQERDVADAYAHHHHHRHHSRSRSRSEREALRSPYARATATAPGLSASEDVYNDAAYSVPPPHPTFASSSLRDRPLPPLPASEVDDRVSRYPRGEMKGEANVIY